MSMSACLPVCLEVISAVWSRDRKIDVTSSHMMARDYAVLVEKLFSSDQDRPNKTQYILFLL